MNTINQVQTGKLYKTNAPVSPTSKLQGRKNDKQGKLNYDISGCILVDQVISKSR